MSCHDLPIEDLVAHLDDELSAAESARVAAHVAACAPCSVEADLLGRSGALVAGLAQIAPSAGFSERVLAAAASDGGAAPAGRLFRFAPVIAAAAAAIILVVVGARLIRDDAGIPAPGDVLTAREEDQIVRDLELLMNLETLLDEENPAELAALVDALPYLEAVEPAELGLFAMAEGEDGR